MYSMSRKMIMKAKPPIREKKSTHIKQTDICKYCNKKGLFYDEVKGQQVCQICGIVIKENCIDNNKDWRSYNIEEELKKARCGPIKNFYLYDGGLSTNISSDNKDFNGNKLSSQKRYEFNRIRKLDKQSPSNNSLEQNFKTAVMELNILSSERMFNLTKPMQERVIKLYRSILKSQIMKGFSIRSILLVLIHRIFLENQVAITLYDITTKGKITNREFNRYSKIIMKFFNFKPIFPEPKNYLQTLFIKLNIKNQKLINLTTQICNIFTSYVKKDFRVFAGKDTSGIAGGALYLACRLLRNNITQTDISKAISCTEVTIRSRYRDILTIFYKLYSHKKFSNQVSSIFSKHNLSIKEIFDIIS